MKGSDYNCPECGGKFLLASAGAVCEHGCGRIIQDREVIKTAKRDEIICRGPRDFRSIPPLLRALKKLCEEVMI